jgi:hypothetical protein
MINAKLQNIIDTKSAIGNAINNKGGSITVETPFYEYAPAIENISTGGGAYSTFVAQAQDNSLYTVYNGYDAITNPTPTTEIPFNVWLLNNSATGDVILSNAKTIVGGTFNGINTVSNQSNLALSNRSAYNLGGFIWSLASNNGSIFAASYNLTSTANSLIRKHFIGNLANETTATVQSPTTIAVNNGFVYIGGETNLTIRRHHEGNLVFVNNSASYGGSIQNIVINNGFIYAGGGTTRTIRKYHESNFAYVGETAGFGGDINGLAINNGFIYAGGATNRTLQKFYESNLAFVGNTVNDTGGTGFRRIHIDNGFIYAGGFINIDKFHEDNLAIVGNTPSNGVFTIWGIDGLGNYIYGTTSNLVRKFYKSNLAFLANTAEHQTSGEARSMRVFNGFIYVGGTNSSTFGNTSIGRYQTQQVTTFDNQTFYNIKTIKE